MPAQPDHRRSPSIRRRRLSRELRSLRTASGHTAEEVCRTLEWSQGKMSRIEQGDWLRPNPRDVRDLLDFYDVQDVPKRESLISLARESRQRGWWETTEFAGLFNSSLAGFEAEAKSIHTYQPLVVPGLLQTPAYTRDLFRRSMLRDPSEVGRRVEFRMNRQKLLQHHDPPTLWAVIDESVLRRPFGTVADRAEQIQRLLATGDSDHTTVQVIPFEAGLHPGLNYAFTLMDYELDPSVVYIELGTNALYLEKPKDLESHSLKFQHLLGAALDKDATLQWLSDLHRELR
ncbi:helix-turn-helix domain-containing protein [Actinomadura harenae]|uniref:XRE family transcriptional regulator n=1 Tax=Actinomadura harenae TaxID=2483351 RepID=A0A3M2LT54_9ACTN|nr:helix-turn-helix transcriptional regulator [Actinomadura harenae]RMI40669.1 XRE family transcriptional regulator [Actinomadura harenae]